jgi:hypothetical protein
MSVPAILFMSISVLGVVVLAAWCYYTVMTRPDRVDDAGEARDEGKSRPE